MTRRRRAAGIVAAGLLFASSCSETADRSGASSPTTVVSVVAGPPPAIAAGSGASGWPVAFRDVRHSGQASVAGPTTGRLRWVRQLEGNVTPGPVVGTDGTIYVASNAGVLHALDPATGADRWTLDGGHQSGGDLSSSPAVLASGVIVWPSGSFLTGVSRSGKQLWQLDLDAPLTSPMPVDDRVYVMSMDGVLHAIDLTIGAASAQQVWEFEAGNSSYASVAVAPDGSIITNAGSDVVAVTDRGDIAEERWRQPLGTLSEISPGIAADGTVVSGGNDRWIHTFSRDGAPLKRYDRETESYSSPIVTESGIVLQGNHRAAVVGVDLASGERTFLARKRVKQPGRSAGIWTAPVADANGNVYFGTRSGRIVGFSWSGALLFDINAGDTATIDSYPAITADGALIVGDTNGIVRAIADDGALPSDVRP